MASCPDTMIYLTVTEKDQHKFIPIQVTARYVLTVVVFLSAPAGSKSLGLSGDTAGSSVFETSASVFVGSEDSGLD